MNDSLEVRRELQWVDRQRVNRAAIAVDGRQARRRFALVLAGLILTLAVAWALPR
jgi:type II secretory pathway component PulM